MLYQSPYHRKQNNSTNNPSQFSSQRQTKLTNSALMVLQKWEIEQPSTKQPIQRKQLDTLSLSKNSVHTRTITDFDSIDRLLTQNDESHEDIFRSVKQTKSMKVINVTKPQKHVHFNSIVSVKNLDTGRLDFQYLNKNN